MGGIDDFFFMRATAEDVLMMSVSAAIEAYTEMRIPHRERHGIPSEGNHRVCPIIMAVDEMEALLRHFDPAKGEVPDALCPLLSEIAWTLKNHMVIQPQGSQNAEQN